MGKRLRFIISHKGDPATSEGIARVEQIKTAAEEALKGTPLVNAKIYLAGTAVDRIRTGKTAPTYDLLIAGIAALCLIFIIMLIITRSFIAALVIVGTVALSLGASFGLSVLVWQYILGIDLHWMVLAMSVIILLAVGSDYNLLLVSRMKEEIGAGINTGIIRAMGGTGKVVTTAGLVFAFTMASMVVSDLRIIGQIGTTIGLGLLFDTLIVRSFMTPSIAALLGRWFWWPQTSAPPPRQCPTSAVRAPSACSVLAAEGGAARRRPSAMSSATRLTQNPGLTCCHDDITANTQGIPCFHTLTVSISSLPWHFLFFPKRALFGQLRKSGGTYGVRPGVARGISSPQRRLKPSMNI